MKKMATIKIENINIVVENNEMALVKVDYHAQGKVLRTGRGTLEVSIEEFVIDNSVDSLKDKVKTAIIDELNNHDDNAE